jgi:diguanylate cyclase (GGDEF)-like protein
MARIAPYRTFALAGSAGAGLCALVVPAGLPQLVAFEAIGAACVMGIIVGIRINRPRHAWPWIFIALSVALTTCGYLVSGLYQHFLNRLPPAVSVVDAFYLAGSLCFVAGCIGFVPSWRGRDREVLLDVGIAGTAAAIFLWATVVDPQMFTPVPLAQRLVVILYPLVDVAVLAILSRLAFIPGRRPGALWFVLGGFGSMLVAAVGYATILQTGSFNGSSLVGMAWLLGLVSLATGALHPKMRRLTEHGETTTTLTWGRGILLGMALLVAPVAVVVKELHEPHLGAAPIAGASVIVAALVLWRIVRGTNERQRAESTLAHRASHDRVTGLPNRDLLLDQLRTALGRLSRTGSRLEVIYLDLDLFKEVNDGFGHEAGDNLLVSVSERLQKATRPGDTVARLGGDEFVVLAEDVESHLGAAAIAERVREALAEPFAIAGQEVFCTASLGMAVTDRADASPEHLLRDADAAMCRAKELGRDRSEFFDDSMRAAAMEGLKLDAELRRALERGEFELYYQPLLHIGTGAIVGVESLIRWNHPERGLLAPKEFIPAAEASGLIRAIGWWVIREALDQAGRWRETGSPLEGLTVGVNISPTQLRDPDFVDRVAALIEQSGTPAHQLCIELTESALIDDVASSLGTVQALKGLGVRIALDDFGTGYSSLSYLQRFPVDSLKIDISFISGLGKDPEDDVIVAAIVAMAQQLGLNTVAEGVETNEQLDVLRASGCTIAQGYLIARPTRAQDLEAVYAQFNAASEARPVALVELEALSTS